MMKSRYTLQHRKKRPKPGQQNKGESKYITSSMYLKATLRPGMW